MKIVLRLPPKALWPNARVHWREKAKWTRECRSAARSIATMGLRLRKEAPPQWERANVKLVAYFKTNRQRDGDNLIAAAKAMFDGLADAGIVRNDCGFTHLPPEMRVDKTDPRLEIEVTGEV